MTPQDYIWEAFAPRLNPCGLGQLQTGEELGIDDGNTGGGMVTVPDLFGSVIPTRPTLPPQTTPDRAGTQGNGQVLSDWLHSSFDLFGLAIPNVLGLAAAIGFVIYSGSKK